MADTGDQGVDQYGGCCAQRKQCKERALAICASQLEAGGYYAMETADSMQAVGNSNPMRFCVCRIIPWEDGGLVKQHTDKRQYVGGKYNRQQVSKGDPLVRVCYYPLDTTDSGGAVFVDSESISIASGLGMRHKIDDGSFSKVGG